MRAGHAKLASPEAAARTHQEGALPSTDWYKARRAHCAGAAVAVPSGHRGARSDVPCSKPGNATMWMRLQALPEGADEDGGDMRLGHATSIRCSSE